MSHKNTIRIKRLLHILQQINKLHLKQAAHILGVSEMTIRRDIDNIPSPILLLGGYLVIDPKETLSAYLTPSQIAPIPQNEEKKLIAKIAVQLIQKEEVIFFDCGTTIRFIIEQIPNHYPFTALCYSLNTFLALQNKTACVRILCGGTFKSNTHPIFIPSSQSSELTYFRPHKAFMSASGIDLKHGVTSNNADEIPIKNKALKQSLECILVLDSSKFDTIHSTVFSPIDRFQRIVTDKHPPEAYQYYCKQQGIILSTPEKAYISCSS